LISSSGLNAVESIQKTGNTITAQSRSARTFHPALRARRRALRRLRGTAAALT
jgi:phage terminase small subunit